MMSNKITAPKTVTRKTTRKSVKTVKSAKSAGKATETTIATGYEPRPHQSDLHRQLQRFNVLVTHRRFGKTVFAINELIDQALRCELPRPRYGYLAPFSVQAKTVGLGLSQGLDGDVARRQSPRK